MCVDENRCTERMKTISKDISDITSRIDKHEERLEKIESSQNDFRVEMAQIQSEVKIINANTKDTKADVKKILDKPAQYWDKVVLTILGAVAGYLINLFFR